MAEITGIYTASHTPVMLNFPDRIPAALRDEIFDAYRAMGKDFMSGNPDVLIVLSNDHLHNFFLAQSTVQVRRPGCRKMRAAFKRFSDDTS